MMIAGIIDVITIIGVLLVVIGVLSTLAVLSILVAVTIQDAIMIIPQYGDKPEENELIDDYERVFCENFGKSDNEVCPMVDDSHSREHFIRHFQ